MSCTSPDPPDYCAAESPELKLYQAFIFSVPVFFAFIFLLFFYLFYLRRRGANWQSLQMRTNILIRGDNPRTERGLKKEMREMLPVVVFKESLLVRETQCSVCLADYQPEERLQRLPPCGHTFHIDCIDHWLSTNTVCPLCRASLLPAPKTSSVDLDLEAQNAEESLVVQYQEGLAENTPQEDQVAEPGGTDDSHGEEPSNEGESVMVTEVAEPEAVKQTQNGHQAEPAGPVK